MMRRRNKPVPKPVPELPIPAEGIPLKLVSRKRLREEDLRGYFAAGPQCPTCGKCPTCGRPIDTPDQSDAEDQRHE